MKSALRIRIAALAATAIFAASGATAAQVGEKVGYAIVTVIQAPPVLVNVEPPQGGPGGTSYYEAELSLDGKPFGRLHGTSIKSDVTPDSSGLETRMRTLVFDLPKGQLVAIGTSEVELAPGNVPALPKPATVAIVGGTGIYGAARGQVTSIRVAEGTYEHVLMILK